MTPKGAGANPTWENSDGNGNGASFCFALPHDQEPSRMMLKVEVWNWNSEGGEGGDGANANGNAIGSATLLGSATVSGATLLDIADLRQYRAKNDPDFVHGDDENSDGPFGVDVEESDKKSDKAKEKGGAKEKEKGKGKGKGKKAKGGGEAVVECKLAFMAGGGGKAGAAGVVELRFSADKEQMLEALRTERDAQMKSEVVTGSMRISAILADRSDFFDVVPKIK